MTMINRSERYFANALPVEQKVWLGKTTKKVPAGWRRPLDKAADRPDWRRRSGGRFSTGSSSSSRASPDLCVPPRTSSGPFSIPAASGRSLCGRWFRPANKVQTKISGKVVLFLSGPISGNLVLVTIIIPDPTSSNQVSVLISVFEFYHFRRYDR